LDSLPNPHADSSDAVKPGHRKDIAGLFCATPAAAHSLAVTNCDLKPKRLSNEMREMGFEMAADC
jgi:hypothetical protein